MGVPIPTFSLYNTCGQHGHERRESNEQTTVTLFAERPGGTQERCFSGLQNRLRKPIQIKKQCSPALLVTFLSLQNSPVLWFCALPNWFQHGCRPGSCHWAAMAKASSNNKVGRTTEKEQRNNLYFLHSHLLKPPTPIRALSSFCIRNSFVLNTAKPAGKKQTKKQGLKRLMKGKADSKE